MLRIADMESLRRTRAIAERLAHKFASHGGRMNSPPCNMTAEPMSHPLPDSLTPKLRALGVDGKASESISSVLTKAASRLKAILERDYERQLQQLQSKAQCFQGPQFSSRIPSVYSAIYARAIREWTNYILDDIVPRVLQVQRARIQTLATHGLPGKRHFSQVCVLRCSEASIDAR